MSNFRLLSFVLITIKGTAVIQSDRNAAWQETSDQLNAQEATQTIIIYLKVISLHFGHKRLH